jgi:Phosphotransferase system mannitol/fructose-specific IIA domain (Ntr-type)
MENFSFLTMFDVEADSRDELLDKIYDNLHELGYVRDTFGDAVKQREIVYPTGIETTLCGVAIPHVETEHVVKNGVCAVTLKKPVAFGMMGGEETDTVEVECLFAILLNARTDHLKLLVRFMNVLQNEDDLKRVRKAHTNEEVEEVLSKYIV